MANLEEIRRKQREKIQAAKQRQAAMEQHAQTWDPVVSRLLRQIGEATWGPAARLRHWHGDWEIHAAIPAHPHYRVGLRLNEAGVPSHFVVKCAAGELETTTATEEALADTLRQATEAGPAGWP